MTGTSPVLSIGDVECGTGPLSPPILRFDVVRIPTSLSVVSLRQKVAKGYLGRCSAQYAAASSQIPFDGDAPMTPE